MKKILIFGNSGSGKSTLAKRLYEGLGLAHLDLDLLAWQPTQPPQRQAIEASALELQGFTRAEQGWVIEGCYTDLLQLVAGEATDIIFMDLPIEACKANARQRPWEPHKYPTKMDQDKNLPMLIEWIAQYAQRDDVFSQRAHSDFFEHFTGNKRRLLSNQDVPLESWW